MDGRDRRALSVLARQHGWAVRLCPRPDRVPVQHVCAADYRSSVPPRLLPSYLARAHSRLLLFFFILPPSDPLPSAIWAVATCKVNSFSIM